jgi:hypothetical protein
MSECRVSIIMSIITYNSRQHDQLNGVDRYSTHNTQRTVSTASSVNTRWCIPKRLGRTMDAVLFQVMQIELREENEQAMQLDG